MDKLNILTKQFIVVYDDENIIISKSEENDQTFVGKGRKFAEFDSKEELDSFIEENMLIEIFESGFE